MPGPQIKDWDKYHALRRRGMSKMQAAKITNAGSNKQSKNSSNQNSSKQHREK